MNWTKSRAMALGRRVQLLGEKMVEKYAIAVACLLVALSLGCDRPEKDRQVEEVVAKTIVAVGDSLTAGYGVNIDESYPAVLEEKLRQAGYAYQVINAGVSGETSSGTLARLDWLLTLNPDAVILTIGANDGLRAIDPDLVEANLRQIIEQLQQRDIVVIFAGMKMVANLGPGYVSRFNRIYPSLAREYGVAFYPFFLDGVAMQPAYNLADGIHPNAAGYHIIADNLYPVVLEALAGGQGQ
jgi:acyl-CoA thioesterase I